MDVKRMRNVRLISDGPDLFCTHADRIIDILDTEGKAIDGPSLGRNKMRPNEDLAQKRFTAAYYYRKNSKSLATTALSIPEARR